jgi:phospholipid/cholesterol/gamma-HCH transport system ATP-binding protein
VSDVVVRLSGVVKRFAGKARPLLDGIDLEIRRGETWALLGPAAAGKTVLLKLICGLLEPDAGTIEVAGQPLGGGGDLARVRAQIGLLFQNNALFDFLSVAENVAFPLRRAGVLSDGEIDQRVKDKLRQVGLHGSEDKLPGQLSGGMRKRAALARAVIAEPPIIIYDEPSAGLDPVTTSRIYDLLRAERDRTGATVLAVSSDVSALCAFAPRAALLYQGKLLWDGPSAEIAAAPHPVVRQFVSGGLEGPL